MNEAVVATPEFVAPAAAESSGARAVVAPLCPRVSVVMPVHNGMPYLPLALDSILAQSFEDFEFIVVDDASTDATAEVAADYARRDRRICLLTNARNLGISGAINVGLEGVRGELIARMDADDIAHPDRLRRQVAFLDAHPDHVVVGASCNFIDAAGRMTHRDLGRTAIEDWELRWIGHFWTPLVHPTAMLRASLVQQRGLRFHDHYRASQDMDFFARALDAGKGCVLRERLLDYRWHNGNTSTVSYALQKRESCEIASHHLVTRYPLLQPRAALVNSLVGLLHRQGLAPGQPLLPVADMLICIERQFRQAQPLSRRQRRRIQCLTACWLLWGLLQSGRLRPSVELWRLTWRARTYWAQLLAESLSVRGLLFAADSIRRLMLARARS
jgi:glycosyltransferase involved in cell wall biosynthesis